ncbi:TIGR03564 family F420-dependent LLM class oxidoreductase [Micromonospora sp. NBC_01796]|uniref:TIGR03564 family F420-dependent LLM class oxidoreductase n=1 Tax=Micromonospora sp. NBC_01796 TaxID=2975987 RepID=UPI002DD94FE0|nr:TIGR03564 family F420-dependent LLM class oxidoreductase [Micromonospora sp. NBC_01796]WSA87585.1 TIGR03564 family F420-dependent LLM class oxidoreductase [Micromonospora sp. NBC_01796]
MQIGLSSYGTGPLPDLLTEIEEAAASGFSRFWLGEHGGWDPLAVFAALGDRAPGIEVATSVVGMYPRHPLALAAQALTTQAATGGRLTVGVGPSHAPVVRGRYGLDWHPPLRHTREVLDVLVPVLRGEEVQVSGTGVSAVGGVAAPGTTPPSLLLAANGPRMLALAGELTDGALTMWVTPRFLDEVVVPTVTTSAAGRVVPRIAVGLLASVTSDVDATRAGVARNFSQAATLPTFRALLDRQGFSGPEETLVVGDETVVERTLARFADAGATELIIFPVGLPEDRDRTVALFADLAKRA